MQPKDIRKLLSLANKFNLRTLKVSGLEFEFFEAKPEIKKKLIPIEPQFVVVDPKDLTAQMPPDDEMLHYSTPYFDIQKKQRAEG